jgi:hypothetical protein
MIVIKIKIKPQELFCQNSKLIKVQSKAQKYKKI